MTTTKLPARGSLGARDRPRRPGVSKSLDLAALHARARARRRAPRRRRLARRRHRQVHRTLAKDKFLVDEPSSTDRIWWGEVNQKLAESNFDGLRDKVTSHLGAADALFVIDAWAGADPAHRIGVRVVTAHPYHALFAKTMFIDPTDDELARSEPQALVLHTPDLEADPDEDGTRTSTRRSCSIPAGPSCSSSGRSMRVRSRSRSSR